MVQPRLLDLPEPKRHRRTRETSIASYAHGRETFTGRKADVLRWLAAHWNERQVSPTSAELAKWKQWNSQPFATDLTDDWVLKEHEQVFRLHVRRGISDLVADGLIETIDKRTCAVTGRICQVWRVTQR